MMISEANSLTSTIEQSSGEFINDHWCMVEEVIGEVCKPPAHPLWKNICAKAHWKMWITVCGTKLLGFVARCWFLSYDWPN